MVEVRFDALTPTLSHGEREKTFLNHRFKISRFCEALHPPFSSRSLIFKRQKLKHRFNAYLTTLELTQ